MTDRSLFLYKIGPQLAERGPKAGKPKRVKIDATKHVTDHQITNARNAFSFADAQGTRLNTLITVKLNRLKGAKGWVARSDTAQQTIAHRARVLKKIGDWCRRNQVPPAWVVGIENLAGAGPHLHILMHLPEDSEPRGIRVEGEPDCQDVTWQSHFEALKKFLDRLSGWDKAELQEVYAHLKTSQDRGEERQGRVPIYVLPKHLPRTQSLGDSALTKLAYICKCMDPHMILQDDGDQRVTVQAMHTKANNHRITVEESSDVYCRVRVAASESISLKARQTAEWVEDQDLGWINHRKSNFDAMRLNALEMLRLFNAADLNLNVDDRDLV